MTGVRLKALATLRASISSSEELPFLSLDLVESGTGRLIEGATPPTRPPPESGAAEAQVGDVLFGKLRPYLAKSVRVDRHCYASTELLCLRPTENTDERWLAYLVQSQPFVDWATASADGTKMPRTSWGKLSEFRLNQPPRSVQRAIADYLDAETARIDALIAKKRRQLALISERFGASRDLLLLQLAECLPLVRLRSAVELVTVGIVVRPADLYSQAGAPFLRGQNLAAGTVNDRDLRLIGDEDNLRHSKSKLRRGDVLVSRVGLSGQAAAVPEWAVGGNCVGMLLVRPGPLLLPLFVEHVVNASFGQQQLRALAGGSVQEVLNVDALASMRIPLCRLDGQVEFVQQVEALSKRTDQLVASLDRQVALLVERRQALITAAVTGELAVPEVAA